jgi:hypothetical protein
MRTVVLGDVPRVITFLWFSAGLGLICLLFPAYASSTPWRVLAVGSFLAGAASLTGSAIGFLFGVPKRSSGLGAGGSYVPNTNLERISDWLTKILIGAGLSQAGDLTEALVRLARFAGPALADDTAGPTIVGALIVHYLLVGFFQGYLLAYLWLPRAFTRVFPTPARSLDERRPSSTTST